MGKDPGSISDSDTKRYDLFFYPARIIFLTAFAGIIPNHVKAMRNSYFYNVMYVSVRAVLTFIRVFFLVCFPALFPVVGHTQQNQNINFPTTKLSYQLLDFLENSDQAEKIQVRIVVSDSTSLKDSRPDIDFNTLFHQLTPELFVTNAFLTSDQIAALISYSFVLFIEKIRKPHVELRQEGLDMTLNQITALQYDFKDLKGENMIISIKENLFDTSDIDFKGRVMLHGIESDVMDVHATNMATIIAGGGNSHPSAKGVVPDAGISSSDFSNLFPDSDTYFSLNNISVQNHAYGTGIENYYGPEAVAYDAITNRLPWLVHIFSSGNMGDQIPPDGNYTGLTAANITGHFKHSKNTITVGATDSLHHVVPLSSRGPAYDGRIKPEIIAYGHGGTSGAAAIVSGVASLIQEVFMKNNNDSIPPSSLVRAVIINTSLDIDFAGPDFISGYGALQALKAIESIENGEYFISRIGTDEMKAFPLEVPPLISQLKITIAWNDPAAVLLSDQALVHDIDIELEDLSTGATYLPWILNSSPNADSLSQSAIRGRDTINNVEQITIDDPLAGDYLIHIRGRKIHQGLQEFSLVWEMNMDDSFTWTFPGSTDHILPGQKNILRWEYFGKEKGKLEFRWIGNSWQPIDLDVSMKDGWFSWTPEKQSGAAQLRMSFNDTTIFSDTFLIIDAVVPHVVFVCNDSLLLSWENGTAHDSFEIFRIGPRHMEHFDFTNDTFFQLPNPGLENRYFAVAPVINNLTGPLSYAFDYTQQGAGCYLNAFYLRYIFDQKAFFTADLGTLTGIHSIALETLINGEWITLYNILPLDTASLLFESGELQNGTNFFRLRVNLINGEEIFSEVVIVYFLDGKDLLLFPNPVTGNDDLHVLSNDDLSEIRVYDMIGKEVIDQRVGETPILLDIRLLPPGIYIIHAIALDGFRVSGVFEKY